MSNTVRSADIELIVADARDWELYTERHPDAWQGKEWAIEIVRKLLAAAGES